MERILDKNGIRILRRKEVKAESWAWRGKDGELCFDSIEAKSGINVVRVANLYVEASKKLLGKLGITRITVGLTSYGITGDIRNILGVDYKATDKPAKMIKKVKYTDAKNQWLLPLD